MMSSMRMIAAFFLLFSFALHAQDHAQHQRNIERDLGTRVAIEGVQEKSLEQRMKDAGVPAVSFAVVDGGRIVMAAAYGQADVALGRPATTSTLFQAASISKPVTALGVIDLVERGRLLLDAEVNSILTSWQLPANDFTKATPVTLRQLLSHSGGTTVHGFPGYAPAEKHPTLRQVLNGTPPANTAPVVVDSPPNVKFRYSGGGTTIVQAALMDHTGSPFPTFMRRNVLQPLGMTASTYEQPLPASRRALAATAYRANLREVEGKWHVYPEMAAAGLWTTPTDLAKVILEVQNALAGRPTKLISIDAARLMLTPRFSVGGTTSIGLGFFVDKDTFSHGGSNEGFRTNLHAWENGRGIVVMTNSDTGSPLVEEVMTAVAREYQWPGHDAAPLKQVALDAQAARYEGRYLPEGSKDVLSIRRTQGGLEVLGLSTGWVPLYAIADGRLARADRDARYALTADGIEVVAGEARVAARRLPPNEPLTGGELLAAGSIEEALAAYRKQDPATLEEAALNRLGYSLLFGGRVPQGVAILQLNTELYPTSANAWDSYGEALATAGRKEEAIRAYEEVLRQNPEEGLRQNALKQLEMLRR